PDRRVAIQAWPCDQPPYLGWLPRRRSDHLRTPSADARPFHGREHRRRGVRDLAGSLDGPESALPLRPRADGPFRYHVHRPAVGLRDLVHPLVWIHVATLP